MNISSPRILERVVKATRMALAIAAFFTAVAAYAAANIPPLTWTPRSDWLNVKSAPFNAVGDGVADDTAAIQAALTLAGTCNSTGQMVGPQRTVYLPPGTYKITSTLTWKGTNTPWTDGGSGMQLVGCGQNTTVRWAGSSGAAMFLSQGAFATRYTGITWDGNNLAGAGVVHAPSYTLDDNIRHENEAFLNFVVTGTYAVSGTLSDTTIPGSGIVSGCYPECNNKWSGDALIWNCLFKNCSNGLTLGRTFYNDVGWFIEGCEFESCGTGVYCHFAFCGICDTHFQGSTVVDITSDASTRQYIRGCTSQGSKAFFTLVRFGANADQIIQDCWVDSWAIGTGTSNTAIELDTFGPFLVSDCVFTNPPSSAPPIGFSPANTGTGSLILCNCYAPSCTGLVTKGAYGKMTTVPPGSLGGTVAVLSSATTTFLQQTWPTDSANIIDVTGTAYGADNTGKNDSTTAIQNAINAAMTANNGSIVYLPLGSYKITSTLSMTGSNYVVQGSGFCTNLEWSGTNTGTVVSVTSPNCLSLEHLRIVCPTTATAINHTATTAGDMTYDEIYQWATDNLVDYTGTGLHLVSLPAGARVFLPFLSSPLTVTDCGPAEIYGDYIENGCLIVNGTTQAKTGLLAISHSMEGQQSDSSRADILVDDNQDLVIGHMYGEGSYDHLRANRGAANWSGRVTIQGTKQGTRNGTNYFISVNNYQGRILYGPTYCNASYATNILQSGTNPVDLILPGIFFYTAAPSITTSASCNFTQIENNYGTTPETYPADTIAPGGLASTAAGFDHERQLWAEDMKLIHGIQNTVSNSFFETDVVNSSPLTTMGTPPASWTVTGGTATGSGVRAVSVISGTGSPFASGTQSADFVDTTGTTTGSSLSISQNTIALPANVGAVFSFDFCANSMTNLNESVAISVLAGTGTAFSINLLATGSTSSLGTAPFSVGTWYRVRAIIPPPSAPTGTIVYTLTPWNGSTATYSTVGLLGGRTQGLSNISFAQTSAGKGKNTNISIDNVTLVAGDPLVSGSCTVAGGYWNFNDKTGNDDSGNGNNGTLINSPVFSASVPFSGTSTINYYSLQFTGSNRVEIANSAFINPGAQLTVAFWMKSGTTGYGWGRIVSKDGESLSSPGWEITQVLNSTSIMLRIDTSAATNQGTSIANVADNNWHYIAFVINNGSITGYKDGVQAVTNAYNSGSGVANANAALEFGAGQAGAGPYTGYLDEVRIFDAALSASQISTLYNTR